MEELQGENKPVPASRSIGREIWEFIRVLIIAALIVLPLRYFIAQPFIVKGASMEPTFKERDYLIIDEASYYFRNPMRGEVIVFKFPLNPSEYFIKRVIGLPGETVVISNGKVFIASNFGDESKQLIESYLPDHLGTAGEVKTTLGPGQYFVLGDNRTFSLDSRTWGILPRADITGRVLVRAWPPQKAEIVSSPAY